MKHLHIEGTVAVPVTFDIEVPDPMPEGGMPQLLSAVEAGTYLDSDGRKWRYPITLKTANGLPVEALVKA